ncbi:MAG: hypothetical protein ACTHYO_12895 [Micrococcaceae bacterium]
MPSPVLYSAEHWCSARSVSAPLTQDSKATVASQNTICDHQPGEEQTAQHARGGGGGQQHGHSGLGHPTQGQHPEHDAGDGEGQRQRLGGQGEGGGEIGADQAAEERQQQGARSAHGLIWGRRGLSRGRRGSRH